MALDDERRAVLLAVLGLLVACSQAHNTTEEAEVIIADPVRGKRLRHREVEPDSFTEASCLLGVFSGASQNSQWRRDRIRATWASSAFLQSTSIRLVFIIAASSLTTDSLMSLDIEKAEYNDIHVLPSSFGSISNRGTTEFDYLRWAVSQTQADGRPYAYVAKMEQDVWLHPFNFQRALATMLGNRGQPLQLATADNRLVYWGATEELSDSALYVRGELWVLSEALLRTIVSTRDNVMEKLAGEHNSSWPNGFELGKVVQYTAISTLDIQTMAAKSFEIYDWGRDKNPRYANLEADSGLMPPETIAVGALKHGDDYQYVHQAFVSNLIRWKACVAVKFELERCHQVLNYEQNLTC